MMCFDNWICCVVSALEHLISGVDETLRCIRETGGEKERERERESKERRYLHHTGVLRETG